MNIDTGDIYKTKKEAIDAGVHEDKIVEGTPTAIEELKKKLFPKSKRVKLK